ncbi:MAG: hypothetical protein LBB46_06140 [Coriobacteriaceae bacterium]|jgi:hypothetical protein|nr:hypothetical protein [Coriobacteriaceae bacterium]
MVAEAVLRNKGMQALVDSLGMVEAERFITLVIREPFDYTEWRQGRFDDVGVSELSARAQAYCVAQEKETRR